jgi:hypothetical protein
MADIINLRRARKAKYRQAAAKTADSNRLKYGRGKTEKALRAKEDAMIEKTLDQRRLDPTPRKS